MCPRIRCLSGLCFFFFFFNDTATTEIYTLSLHDALPISALAPEPPLAVIPFDPYGGAIYVPAVINGDSAWLMLDTGLSRTGLDRDWAGLIHAAPVATGAAWISPAQSRSEEDTSELQSRLQLVCP